MLDERIEIPIPVQQRQVVKDAPGRDQRVDRLSNRSAYGSQTTVIPCRFDGDVMGRDHQEVERRHEVLRLSEMAVAPRSLQNLDQHQVADEYSIAGKYEASQLTNLDRVTIRQPVDPYA